MGYLHKGVCYPAQVDARVAACSDYPLTWGDAAGLHSVQCSATIDFSSTSMTLTRTTDGASPVTIVQPWPTQPDCNFSGSTDLAYDWMGAALLLLAIVWGGKRLINLFDQHHTTE